MDDRDSKLTRSAPVAPEEASFSSQRLFVRHWRESLHYFGWWRSLKESASAIWSALLELLPSRRKARFGDLDYDWEHSTDTTRSNVGAGTQFLTGVTARPYFATEPWLFEQIMQAIAVDFSQFTFIDLGSGKGRVLLMASDYPFQRIVGVEFMPDLHRAAQKNIARYSSDRQQCHRTNRSAWMREIFNFLSGRWWCICSILLLSRLLRKCLRICGNRWNGHRGQFMLRIDSGNSKTCWLRLNGWRRLLERSNGRCMRIADIARDRPA